MLDGVNDSKQDGTPDEEDREDKERPDKIIEDFHRPEEHGLRLGRLSLRTSALAPDELHAKVFHVAIAAHDSQMSQKMNPSQTIKDVCDCLLTRDKERAKDLARTHYPFRPTSYKEISVALLTSQIQQAKAAAKLNPLPKVALPDKRKWNTLSYTKLFIHDGFIDRYSGQRLVFHGTLRLLSLLMSDEFPEHSNWALSRGHVMYWELYPTLDHIIPMVKGGKDIESNWVSTNWLNNFIKLDFTLEEIGWTLHSAGKVEEWDGLLHWFIEYIKHNPEYLSYGFLNSWHVAANSCLAELSENASRT